MKNSQVILSTARLVLRTPAEGDDVRLQAFEERNKGRMSPWRTAEAGIYY